VRSDALTGIFLKERSREQGIFLPEKKKKFISVASCTHTRETVRWLVYFIIHILYYITYTINIFIILHKILTFSVL